MVQLTTLIEGFMLWVLWEYWNKSHLAAFTKKIDQGMMVKRRNTLTIPIKTWQSQSKRFLDSNKPSHHRKECYSILQDPHWRMTRRSNARHRRQPGYRIVSWYQGGPGTPGSGRLVGDNNKTNKAQASRFCSTTSHHHAYKLENLWNKKAQVNSVGWRHEGW